MSEDQASQLRLDASGKLSSAALPGQPCRVLAVTGGKGGVGKTNIAINLALALRQLEQRVLLLDADLGLANVDLLLGLRPQFTLQHLVRREAEVSQVVLQGPLGLNVLPGSNGLVEMANLSSLDVVRLLGALRPLEREHDFLLIDTAAGISNTVLRFALAAHEVLLVCTPEPPSVLDAFGMLKALHSGRYAGQLQLIVNMARQAHEAQETYRSLAMLAARYFQLQLKLLSVIPLDEGIVSCVKRQRAFVLERPHSPAARAVRACALALLDSSSLPQPPATRSFFSRLMGSVR